MDLEALMRRHYSEIYRLALSLLGDPGEADAAAQETFIHAARAAAGFRGEAGPRTWLYRIAMNTCRGQPRKRRARRALHAALQGLARLRSSDPGPEAHALQDEQAARLWQAVHRLGETHRLPVILRYVHELSVPEIAQILEIPEGTVHSRLHRARRILQAQLQDGLPAVQEWSEL